MPETSTHSILSQLELHCPDMPRRQQLLLSTKEITDAHRRMINKLIEFLKSAGYEGTVELDTLLVLKEQKTDFNFRQVVDYKLRTVDIYLPDLNIIIEVDGSSHEYSVRKMNMDNHREDFHMSLGLLPPYRIDNGDSLIHYRASRNCRELVSLIREQKARKITHPEEFESAKKRVSDNRTSYYKTYPALRMIFPSLLAQPKINKWVKRHFGLTLKLSGKRSSGRGRRQRIDHLLVGIKVEELRQKHPDIQLKQIAELLGYSVKQLRRILTSKKVLLPPVISGNN